MNINLLNENQLAQLRQLISSSHNIVICAHKSPDGDAVGSALAWAHYLKGQGKRVIVTLPDATPDFLHWLPGFSAVLRYDTQAEQVQSAFDNSDLVCCLDFNSASRLEDMQQVLVDCKSSRLLVDHHMAPELKVDMSISYDEMSSTSEIIFDLIWQLDGIQAVSPAIAQCIYCGMMTDTGGFAYNSSRPEVFFIISQLLTTGINKDDIYNKVFHNYSIHAIRLRSYVLLKKLNYIERLHASFYIITKKEMRRFRFIKGDLEGLVNIPQQIKGLKLSISLREDTERPNFIHVSLRSCNGFHCQPMAMKFFNGGGHADASGGRLDCSVEEAEQIALKAILAYKDELA